MVESFPLQAPVGGWRTDLPEDNMPGDAASLMDNLVSDGRRVFVRGGYEEYADTGTGVFVDTLAQWVWQGSSKLLAASVPSIFDITVPATPVALATGFASAQWQWEQHNNFTLFVNGVDPGQKYDGTTMTPWAPTFTGGGVTTSDMLVVGIYKERIFVGQKDSLSVWYGNPQAIEGSYEVFPLDSIANKGGTLVAIGTYSSDTGSGPDDFISFFTSEGEMIVYAGVDPGNPSAWSLIGVYALPRPVGLRAFHKPKISNGTIITEHGIFRIEEIISATPRIARAGRAVENALIEQHLKYEDQFGWDVVDYSHADWTIVNIPNNVGGGEFVQYVFHGAGTWQRFTNWNGRCWIEWQDRLFFGAVDGTVKEANVGYADGTDNLTFDCRTAYNYFNVRNRLKRFHGVRIVYRSSGKFPISIDWDVDFQDKAPAYNASPTTSIGTPWGSPWGSSWSQPETLVTDWRGVRGEGYAGALRLRGSTVAQPFTWLSWEPMFEFGDVR